MAKFLRFNGLGVFGRGKFVIPKGLKVKFVIPKGLRGFVAKRTAPEGVRGCSFCFCFHYSGLAITTMPRDCCGLVRGFVMLGLDTRNGRVSGGYFSKCWRWIALGHVGAPWGERFELRSKAHISKSRYGAPGFAGRVGGGFGVERFEGFGWIGFFGVLRFAQDDGKYNRYNALKVTANTTHTNQDSTQGS
jgi:hypothetical protein